MKNITWEPHLRKTNSGRPSCALGTPSLSDEARLITGIMSSKLI